MTSSFHLHSSRTNWHQLITEAKAAAGHDLNESLEAYLVITLENQLLLDDLGSTVFATEYLEGMQKKGRHRAIHLRKVGDQCLLVTGLFPEWLIKKTVSLNHLIHIGQNAYHAVANEPKPSAYDPVLFRDLGEKFIGLMDVLHIAGAKRQLI